MGILIGDIVPTAMEPCDAVQSMDDGPYAVEAVLGWCINGLLRNVSEVDDNIHSLQLTEYNPDGTKPLLEPMLTCDP